MVTCITVVPAVVWLLEINLENESNVKWKPKAKYHGYEYEKDITYWYIYLEHFHAFGAINVGYDRIVEQSVC